MLKATVRTFVLVQVLLVATLTATYPLLPDPVATHFGPDGKPDGWRSKSEYAAFLFAASALVSGMCMVPMYLARWLPDSMVNVPNREYWLAPEHRGEAHDRLLALGLAIAAASTGLFAAIHLLTVRANRARPPRLETTEAVGLIVLFLAILAGVVYGFSRPVWNVPADRPEP